MASEKLKNETSIPHKDRAWEPLDLCFGREQTPLWWSPSFHPFNRKKELNSVFLLMLGLLMNTSYLSLHGSLCFLLFQQMAKVQRRSILSLTWSLLQTLQRDFFPPLWSSCLSWVVFFPLLFLQGLARLLAWLEGVEKKGFQNPMAREPQIYFWRKFLKKKATGRNRQYGEGCLFLIWLGLPSILLN